MWNEPNPDPGGEPQQGSSMLDLKEENEQQKLLIAQLKEMLRKEQSTVTQEQLEEYVNALSKVKAKRSRAKKDDTRTAERPVNVDSSKTGKVNLLKQQLEENKAKLAERGKSQKGIEDMVSQLKAQFNDSQQLIQSSPMGSALADNKSLDYDKDTSQEELYNILLLKEKKITEFLTKVQKLEATVLDLQENVKEKDSVIDARTKAITLMTDSLSKRSKDSLDALDDTKEQMRKMQENFIALESDMKARQLKLLSDLKAKNVIISELNEKVQQQDVASTEDVIRELRLEVDMLKQEKEKNIQEKLELSTKLQEASRSLQSLKAASSEKESSEVTKLKKQLDESNKSMIKAKAQSKSKIKDLTKKLEAFKKTSDANALIAQLQNDNTKLSERIAELEEEKGNMQLKMVESTESTKESIPQDATEFEAKITRYETELDEKDKVISLLEADILSLKVELNALNEKLISFPHFENPQVSSEMKNIQMEEEMEKLDNENQTLRRELDAAHKENKDLHDKIDELVKEKQELNVKLDNYVQENMELIDKLEKLSAEKVSSAESIEIVEGLTQQEKLELAAYQKHIDPNLDVSKLPEEVELNESVIQLSEDSDELLKKIEMFNNERKEVMGKMEALREENTALSLKIAGIENNRDVLADMYEQLHSEKDELQKRHDSLLKKVESMETVSKEQVSVSDDSNLTSKLLELQTSYETLLEENARLKSAVKELEEAVQEKHNLDAELHEARTRIAELETKLSTNLEELTNYRTVIEENRNELVNSSALIGELQVKLNERENEVRELNDLANGLNDAVSGLKKENHKLGQFEPLETQVEELRGALDRQMEQARVYAEESSRNNDLIVELNGRLEEMHLKILETEHDIEVKDIELNRLKEELSLKNDAIAILQREISDKDEKIKLVGTEMRDKYLALQKQLDGNNDSLEKQIQELTNKNKEQLEKMKKIAANLKKKTQAYQQLHDEYSAEKQKWESDQLNLTTQLKDLKEEINVKTVKLEEAETRINELLNIEQSLQVSLADLRRKQEKSNEVNLKQELSTSLHEEFEQGVGSEENVSVEKIRELELIVETNEADLNHYKFRLQRLEEEISRVTEERDSLHQNIFELQEALNQASRNIEEKTLREASLEQKLEQIVANDELLERGTQEMARENEELARRVKEQDELINKLKIKVKKAHEKVTQLKASQNSIEELETLNNELKQQLAHLEANQRQFQEENEALQRRNQSDYEKIEADYQGQLEELLRNKNELLVDCEKLREDIRSYKEREEDSLMELKEYKARVSELDGREEISQKLTDELRSITAKLNDAYGEIERLKRQIEELNRELVVQTARATVEDVLTEAQNRVFEVTTKETQTGDDVPTINWPHDRSQPVFDVFAPLPASDIESQILSPEDLTDAADRNSLRKLEFGSVDAPSENQNVPVVEEMLRPKQAYLTYQPGAEAENDDGWGWGPEEAKLEEEHQSRTEHIPQVQTLRAQLAQALEKVQVLQVERDNRLEEIKQLQVKSGKLIKKCKELKAQNDRLSQQVKGKSDGDFFDLDDAIQEELKSQIAQLEKRIKEVTAELDRERNEKGNILRRVDVLTAANERMIENKEIQDAEVFRWKRKYEEAEEKLKQSEWGGDGFAGRENQAGSTDRVEIAELQNTIRELSADNEQLQSLLNEQREMRIRAESLTIDPGQLSSAQNLHEKIKMMEHELSVRNDELKSVLEGKNRIIDELQNQLEDRNRMLESMEDELNVLEENKKKELDKIAKKNDDHTRELAQTVEELRRLNTELREEISRRELVIEELNRTQVHSQELIVKMTEEKAQLENLLQEKETTYQNLRHVHEDRLETLTSQLSELEVYKSRLESDLSGKDLVITQLTGQLSALQDQNELVSLRQQLSQLEETKIQTEALVNEKDAALNQLKTAYDQYVNLTESLTEQNLTLNSDLQTLREKYDRLNEENSKQVEALEEQKRSFEAELVETNKRYEAVQQENHQLRFGAELSGSAIDVEERSRLEGILSEKENEMRQMRERFEGEIETLKTELEEKRRECDSLQARLGEDLQEIEAKWAMQVDERGNTVAESWKNHLAMVEEEFANVQKQLTDEIRELESKCNVLSEENDELRKSSAETQGEVDKVSALQRSINDLTNKLTRQEQENVALREKLSAVGHEEIASLKLIADATQQQFEEKREVVEEIVRILERNSPWPIGCEKQDVLTEFQRQLNAITEKQEEIDALSSQLRTLQTQSDEAVAAKEAEIAKLNETLRKLDENDRDVEQQVVRLERNVEGLQKQVEEKEQEIVRLTAIIDNYKLELEQNVQRGLEDLQNENSTLKQTLENYKSSLESFQQAYSNLEQSFNGKTQEVTLLGEKLQQAEAAQNDNNKEVERLQKEIEALKADRNSFNQSSAEKDQIMFTAKQELSDKAAELENIKAQLSYSQQNVEILEAEIDSLKSALQSKDQEFAVAYENLQKSRLAELETHYEEIVAAKDSDNSLLKAQMAESMQHLQTLSEKLETEAALKREFEGKSEQLEGRIAEMSALLQEEDKQLGEMRAMVEEQAAEIEALKNELYLKSNDYDSLVAEMDIGRRSAAEKAESAMLQASAGPSSVARVDEDFSEPVSRAELDLALYMLHQRDVRCEELTVELRQLLEERDTLQLRLSNALREKEEFRRKIGYDADAPPSSSSQAVGAEPVVDQFNVSTDSQADQTLVSKLSELKKVGYKRDKTFVDEQERRLQEMSLMHQHITDVSRLPPEAAAKLVDASYTLSRDVQSPPKVLLNWLWGRSTPKQNDT